MAFKNLQKLKNLKKHEKNAKKLKSSNIRKLHLKFNLSASYQHVYVSTMLVYVYISENLISKKGDMFHVSVDFGTLGTPLLNDGGEFEAQKQKRKILCVKPFSGFDSNRKSNVKLWRNLKKVFCFTKFVIETDYGPAVNRQPGFRREHS